MQSGTGDLPTRCATSWLSSMSSGHALLPRRLEISQDVPPLVGEESKGQDAQAGKGAVQHSVLVLVQLAVPVLALPVEAPAQEREDGHPPRRTGFPAFQPLLDDQPLKVECGALDDYARTDERAHKAQH